MSWGGWTRPLTMRACASAYLTTRARPHNHPALPPWTGKHVRTCEINFLCIHKKLRSKRLAPVLIKEVTRRVNLDGVFQVRDGWEGRGGRWLQMCARFVHAPTHARKRTRARAAACAKSLTQTAPPPRPPQAAYTAGVVLPKPVTSTRYWHRTLNPKKLVECGFTKIPPRMTMQRMVRGWRPRVREGAWPGDHVIPAG